MHMRRSKRGNASVVFTGAVAGVLAFVVLVLAVALTAQVLKANQDNQGSTSTSLKVNESRSTNGSLLHAGTPTITNNIANGSAVVRNISDASGTTQVLVQGTHYNLTSAGFFTILPQAAGLASGSWKVNVSYNYTVFDETAAYNVSAKGLTGTLNVGDLVPTLGIVFGTILILSLLAGMMFLFNKARE